jgi:chemotaxis protein methyltransferase CheR
MWFPQRLTQLILERTGLDKYIEPQLRIMWASLSDEARSQLLPDLEQNSLQHPTWQNLLHAIAIGETYFMRDQEQLQSAIRQLLTPMIAENRPTPQRPLRVWVAGCATGEEAYSLAILIDQATGRIRDGSIVLKGSDIQQKSIEQARLGRYRGWSLRHQSQDALDLYFIQEGDQWQIRDTLRQAITFEQENLIETPYREEFDLIVCRHMLMYFGAEYQILMEERLQRALKQGRWLVIGRVEQLQAPDLWQETHYKGLRFYQRPAHNQTRKATHQQTHTPSEITQDTFIQRASRIIEPTSADTLTTGEADNIYQIALEAWRSDDKETAWSHLNMLDNANQMHIHAYVLRAALAADERDYTQAHADLGVALGRDALLADAHCLMGIIALEQERWDDAYSALKATLYCDQHHALGALWFGDYHAQRRQIERARHFWQRAYDHLMKKDDEAWISAISNLSASTLKHLLRMRLQLDS